MGEIGDEREDIIMTSLVCSAGDWRSCRTVRETNEPVYSQDGGLSVLYQKTTFYVMIVKEVGIWCLGLIRELKRQKGGMFKVFKH